MIEELKQQKHSLSLRVEELEVKVHSHSSSLRKKERETEVFSPHLLCLCYLVYGAHSSDYMLMTAEPVFMKTDCKIKVQKFTLSSLTAQLQT